MPSTIPAIWWGLALLALAAVALPPVCEYFIRRKIEDGKWLEDREYCKSPDGGIYISIKGYQQWVEKGQG